MVDQNGYFLFDLINYHRCAQAKILDRGQKEQFFEGVEKNLFRGGLEGGHKAPKPHRKWRVGQKLFKSNKMAS